MVDPEEFAAQVNYLAALGRMIVPRAFSFADGGVLFVGHEPFDAWELASLLPEEVESYEQEDAPGGFDPGLVVLGRGGYTKDSLRSVLGELEGSTRIVPQEGFLDELLFGHDWWGEESDSLRRMTDQHGGLQIARSVGVLAPVGLEAEPTPKAKIARPAPVSRPPAKEMPRTPEKAPTPVFSWPSTEAEETKGAIEGQEFDLKARSRLNELVGPIR